MSGNKFSDILSALHLTNNAAPRFEYKFYETRQAVEAWNDNTSEKFIPSGIFCVDESIIPWTSGWHVQVGWLSLENHILLGMSILPFVVGIVE